MLYKSQPNASLVCLIGEDRREAVCNDGDMIRAALVESALKTQLSVKASKKLFRRIQREQYVGKLWRGGRNIGKSKGG